MLAQIAIPIYAVVTIVSTLFPVLTGVARFKLQPRDLRVFFVLMVINSIDSFAQFGLALYNINNLWAVHVYYVIEMPMMLWMFSMWYTKGEGVKIINFVLSVTFVLFWIVSKLTFESMLEPSTYVGPISRVLLTIVSIRALFEISKETARSILTDHRFWVAAGTIIYMAGAVMFYALQSTLFGMPKDVILRVFYVYWTFLIVVNLIYSGAFLCRPIQQSSGGRLVSAL